MSDTPDAADATPADAENTDGEPLGEPGKAALEAERRARKEAERQAREARDQLTALRAEQARERVARNKGLTDQQATFLSGSDVDELEAQADQLLAAFKPDTAAKRRPQERLTSGAVPNVEPEDVRGVADKVMGGW